MAQKLKALRFGDQVFDLTGKADLVGGKVPAEQLPSYVDDVIEVANFAGLPATGEAGKIYITIDNGKIFRWGGSVFAEIPTTPQKFDELSGTITGTNIASGEWEAYKDSFGNIYFKAMITKVVNANAVPSFTISFGENYAPVSDYNATGIICLQLNTATEVFSNFNFGIIYNNKFVSYQIEGYYGDYNEIHWSGVAIKK
jgi:hypothetical protein